LAFAPDGRTLASGNLFIRIWPVGSDQPDAVFKGHADERIWGLAFSCDGRILASAGSDGAVMLFDPTGRQEQRTLARQPSAVWTIAYSPDGKILATAASDQTRLWDISTGSQQSGFPNQLGSGTASFVAFAPNGDVMIRTSSDRTITFRDLQTGRERVVPIECHQIGHAAISPDGKRVGCVCLDGSVQVMDAATGQLLVTHSFGPVAYPALALAPDPRVIAVSHDHTVDVRSWDLSWGQLSPSWNAQAHGGYMSFSPDGTNMAITSGTNIEIRDSSTGEVLKVLRGHTRGPIDSLTGAPAFSPDGKNLATASFDCVKLWDLLTGQEIISWNERCLGTPPAFSPNGKGLAVGKNDYAPGENGKVLLFPPPPLPGEEIPKD
jgi:WD40 repeat protein